MGNNMKGDKIFKNVAFLFALSVLIMFSLLFYKLVADSSLVWQKLGIGFIFGKEWDPLNEEFGALPFIYGTLVTSTLALIISVILSLGIAIFLTEIAPKSIREPVSSIVELIAAIPSVIIGLWGIFVLAPFVRDYLQPVLSHLSFIPFFSGKTLTGLCMLTAVLILTFMITPIIVTIAKDSLLMVPEDLKEAMYSLGARRYEVIKHVCIPYAKNGIFGGVVLGYGRAIGETMAVTMVIGNSYLISLSLLNPGYTMAAVIANEFTEATEDLYLSSLIAIGLLLLLLSIVVNLVGRMIIWKWQSQAKG
jgi:phosphate transport system permease protein